MLLGYIDESYDDEECWLTALLVDDSRHAEVSRALQVVLAAAIARAGINADAELHGYDVFHGAHAWAPLRPLRRLRIGVYSAVLEAIAAHGCAIIHSGAIRAETEKQWPEYHPTEHAHRVAFFGLMKEVETYCIDQGTRALLIADEVSVQSAQLLRRDVRWLQDRPGERDEGTKILDTVHFIRSHESVLVQAADMVGFIHRRARADKTSDLRAAAVNARLTGLVEGSVVARRRWPDQPLV